MTQLLPKIELHLHLDTCLRYEVVRQLAPSISPARYARDFRISGKCPTLADFLARLPPCLALLQTRPALALLTHDVFAQLAADGVIYAELRFAPLLHTDGGLTPEEVVATVAEAAAVAATATGVGYRIILCTLRHFSAEQSLTTARLAAQFTKQGVAGLDLAGDEAGFPLDPHVAAFRFARERGLRLTAHAGEALGAASVAETLKVLGPTRIGHGVRSIEDPRLVQQLKEGDVHLEVCPTSNVLTGVVGSLDAHPVDRLYRAGVPLGVSTDCRGVMPLSLEGEYAALEETLGWGDEHFRRCNVDAARASFAPPEVRAELAVRCG